MLLHGDQLGIEPVELGLIGRGPLGHLLATAHQVEHRNDVVFGGAAYFVLAALGSRHSLSVDI